MMEPPLVITDGNPDEPAVRPVARPESFGQYNIMPSESFGLPFDVAAGDFIGRDVNVFIPAPSKEQEQIALERQRLGEQITRLRGRLTRLIPAEELSDQLRISKYRYAPRYQKALTSSIVGDRAPNTYLVSLVEIETRLSSTEKDIPPTQVFLRAPNTAGFIETPSGMLDDISILQALNSLTDTINVRIARLSAKFIGYINQSAGSGEFLANQITKIGHRELRSEAQTHCDAIAPLINKIDSQKLTANDFDYLSDEAYAAFSILIEIENRKSEIERLIEFDRRRRNITAMVVIAYIGLALGGTILSILRLGNRLPVNADLSELRMPLIGVPWPVIVWALIGSFAAMIHRFNTKPIHDFGDAVKWMLTRPVQGVVLGAAFYLVVISGLFLLTGFSAQNAAASTTDEVILILVFLVGFSDRFANSVFDILMQSISKTEQKDGQDP